MQTILKNINTISVCKEKCINLEEVDFRLRDNIIFINDNVNFKGLTYELNLLLDKEIIFLINKIEFNSLHFKFLLKSYKTNSTNYLDLLKETLKIKNFSKNLKITYEILKDFGDFHNQTISILNIIKYLSINDLPNEKVLKNMIFLYLNLNDPKLLNSNKNYNLSTDYILRFSFSYFINDMINLKKDLNEVLGLTPLISISDLDNLDFLSLFSNNKIVAYMLSNIYLYLKDTKIKNSFILKLKKITKKEKEQLIQFLLGLSLKIEFISLKEFDYILKTIKQDIVVDDIFKYIYKDSILLLNEELKAYHIDFLKYQITKKSFKNLVEENIDIFIKFPKENILFKLKDFTFLNLNTINKNNLLSLLNSSNKKHKEFLSADKINNLYLLDNSKPITFNEFWFLLYKDKYMINLFYRLYDLNLKIDSRLKLLRELPNLNTLFKKWNIKNNKIDDVLNKLCLTLLEKPFKERINSLKLSYKNLISLKDADFLFMFLNFNIFSKFIQDIRTSNDVYFIFNNLKGLNNSNLSLFDFKVKKLQDNFYYQYMIEELNLTSSFLNKYNKNVVSFCEKKLHEVFYSFMNNSNQDILQKENMKKLVKFELTGNLKDIKFIDKDFDLEIGLNVSKTIKEEWKNNLELIEKSQIVKETFNFEDIIRLGEIPVNTCQHWNGGEYSKCLLSNFDTNKKMIINLYNKKINARALIRLTKGSFEEITTKLSFIDVDHKLDNKENKEQIVLFLEKTYSGLDKSQLLSVKKQIIRLAKKKAKLLNVPLIVSESYKDVLANETIHKYNLFISYSKNGCQYLDSLNGQTESIEEGTYSSCYVYML